MKILSTFESRGNIELLSQQTIAVFGSKSTPQEIYPQAETLFKKLLAQPVSIAGGWQAPVEKQLLNFCSLNMQANLILYSAKDIAEVKLTPDLQLLEKEQKLLIVSSQSRQKRATQSDIKKRDELLFSQIKQVLFLYIEPGGRLELVLLIRGKIISQFLVAFLNASTKFIRPFQILTLFLQFAW